MPASEIQQEARAGGSLLRFPRYVHLLSEHDLDHDSDDVLVDRWLPDLRVDADLTEVVRRSKLRAGVTVRLGVLALGHALDAVEQSLAGRAPHAWVDGDRLNVCFNVADDSDHSWIKVVDEGWALAEVFGGDHADLLGYYVAPVEPRAVRKK